MKYLVILFLLFVESLTAQISAVKGRVVGSEDKSPLAYVNVYIEGKNISAVTNDDGYFELSGEIKDDDVILFSHVAFETYIISISEFQHEKSNIISLKSKIITSQTVLVKGSIGNEGITPVTFSKINKLTLRESYTNQDIPELLSYQPSVTFYSENGNGIGYNYLSIRGFDQRRISVSINGVPQNDPEDNNVYWLDFPDILESTELIQIQRGAGSGIIGYPAVGGSINIITSTFSDKPLYEFSSSLGDYNTRKYSLQFSSGLISNKYSLYTKISQTLSSGYRNSSWINFVSYHLSAVRYDENITTQINLYGGPISDGLAYTGLPKFAIKNKEQRRANYSYWEADDKNYTYTLDRRPDEIENFSQPHFELLNEIRFNDNITLNNALFLVLGNGFFDYDGSWSVFYDDYFRLRKNGFDTLMIPTNALIRAQVENKQWGWNPRLSIKHNNGELIFGGEVRLHRSVHWGSIGYAENLPAGVTKDYRYYYYEGGKDIFSIYANENYRINSGFNILAEAQLTYHKYRIENEKYLDNEFAIDDLFFNPRLGMNYRFSPDLNVYFSFARITREPRLKNYYDAAESSDGKTFPQFETTAPSVYDFSKPFVKPETMNDIEIGTVYRKDNISTSLNLFYMLFNNEIVKQGQVDRFGQPITGNIDRTIHLGAELSGSIKLTDNIEFVFNGTYSKNYISQGTTFIKYNKGENIIPLDIRNNRIGGFPDLLFNGIIKLNYGNFFANISAKYVGKFYSDNYDENLKQYLQLYPGIVDEYDDGAEDYFDNIVPAYFTADIYASYEFNLNPFSNAVKIFGQVRNVFDNLYAAYAIGKEFFPAAERNYLFGIKLGL